MSALRRNRTKKANHVEWSDLPVLRSSLHAEVARTLGNERPRTANDTPPAHDPPSTAPGTERAVSEEITGQDPCQREGCGHPRDWHRHNDADDHDITDPACPFRCIGYDCMASGPPPPERVGTWCAVRCPDFVDPSWPPGTE